MYGSEGHKEHKKDHFLLVGVEKPRLAAWRW